MIVNVGAENTDDAVSSIGVVAALDPDFQLEGEILGHYPQRSAQKNNSVIGSTMWRNFQCMNSVKNREH